MTSEFDITLEELELLIDNNFTPQIKTITDYENITHTYRKTDEGKQILFSDNTSIKCSNSHLMLIDDYWQQATDLYIGQFIGNKEIINITPVVSQEWIDFTVDCYHNTYFYNDIIHHNSGKSNIIFLICMFLLEYTDVNILIVVPTTSLVSQMIGDFEDYNLTDIDIRSQCHPIMAGLDKQSKKRITIGTWQSLYTQNEDYFKRYGAVFVDECLHPDSTIQLKNSRKPIKDVQIGDEVLTLNENTNEFEFKPVLKVHKNISKTTKKYKIKLINGDELIVTGNHKVNTRLGWKRVGELSLSDELLINQ
ncbi:MAG: DEAD/DEAH box helicase family protein [Bacteroidales bacterium]|jgi:hypothetical protein